MANVKRLAFAALIDDEVFVIGKEAAEGAIWTNTSSEPLVSLRYFGPNAQPSAPNLGNHQRR